jgi:hypothetical protein
LNSLSSKWSSQQEEALVSFTDPPENRTAKRALFFLGFVTFIAQKITKLAQSAWVETTPKHL